MGAPSATEAFENPSLVGVAPGELAVQVMVIDGAMELSDVQLAVAWTTPAARPPVIFTPPCEMLPVQVVSVPVSLMVSGAEVLVIPGVEVSVPEKPHLA